MRILLVEDDWTQEESIRRAVAQAFPQVTLESISTELEFRNRIDQIAADPPNLAIFDIMIRWTDPSPDLDDTALPPEFTRRDAGLRCHRLLSEHAPRVRTLLYSILDREDVGRDFPANVCHLRKGDRLEPLINKISRMLDLPKPAAR